MAKISAKLPIVASRTTSGFSDGVAVGRLIKVSTAPTQNSKKLYADDALAEEANDTSSVAITLNTDTVPMAVAAKIFGATYAAATTTSPASVEYSSDDVAPFVAFGFVNGEINKNVKSYKVRVYNKVKFSLPSEEFDTKGETITFGTPTINGTAYPDDNGKAWKDYEFDSASAAASFLAETLDYTLPS